MIPKTRFSRSGYVYLFSEVSLHVSLESMEGKGFLSGDKQEVPTVTMASDVSRSR